MKWKRWILPVLVAAAVVSAIVWSLRPQPVLVETAQATLGPMRVTVDEEGKTRIRDRYVVSAPIAGLMQRIPLHEGDPIGAGQILTTITPPPPTFLDPRSHAQGQATISAAESRISAARERLRAAQIGAAYWQAELARAEKLSAGGDIPRSRYDQVLAEQQKAAAAVREAEAAVEAERAAMRAAITAIEQPATSSLPSSATVPARAPVAGRLLRLIRASAGPVSAAEPLVEIGNARAIEVEVELLSPDAVKIAPGARVVFTRWGGERDLEGRVQRIEPTGRTKISALGVEEQRVPVIVDLTSPQHEWSGLGAGYRVEASFILWEAPSVLQIPASAAFRYGESSAVFVLEGTVARRRTVQLGRRAGLYVQVLDGLTAGQRIVAHPDNSIDDGTLVQAR